MKTIELNGLGILGVILGLCGIGYSVYREKKMNDMAKKINLTIDEVASKTPIEVEKAVVDKAASIAVDKAVTAEAKSAASNVRIEMYEEIKRQVRNEVTDITSTIKEKVSEEAADQLDHIDKDMIVKDATKKVASDLMIEGRRELNHQLSGVINDLSSNLSAYKQVYDGVKGALNFAKPADTSKEMTFRIG